MITTALASKTETTANILIVFFLLEADSILMAVIKNNKTSEPNIDLVYVKKTAMTLIVNIII